LIGKKSQKKKLYIRLDCLQYEEDFSPRYLDQLLIGKSTGSMNIPTFLLELGAVTPLELDPYYVIQLAFIHNDYCFFFLETHISFIVGT
jgi:hypothetical protein